MYISAFAGRAALAALIGEHDQNETNSDRDGMERFQSITVNLPISGLCRGGGASSTFALVRGEEASGEVGIIRDGVSLLLRGLGPDEERRNDESTAGPDDYEGSYLPTGHPVGTAEDALDTASGLDLNDPAAWT